MSTINQSSGEIIRISGGQLIVPDRPIIPFIEGDGIGVDIWPVASKVIDAAVDQAYNGKRQIIWKETYAGGKAHKRFHTWLPDDTLETLKTYKISMKGPLTTPIGGGIRSLNVALRKGLDLYVCQRPVRWFNGAPSPMKDPSNVDMVIFRENTEDIYTGFEFEEGAEDTQQFVSLLKNNFPRKFTNIRFPDSSGFSIKPVSKEGTERLVDAAIQWALENNRKSVTFVHKGNIMKFTEGAFRKWGYELAEDRYADKVFTWRQWEGIKKQNDEETANRILELAKKDGKLIIKDIIADIMFEKALTHPHDFDVIATMNLNGDYLSDALVAQVGGVGIAPGANINYQTGTALFEATHGTAPAFAGKNVVNPGSMILSGEMMLRYMGWHEAADLIIKGIEGVIAAKTVTFDFYHLMENATLLKTDAYGKAIIHHMQ